MSWSVARSRDPNSGRTTMFPATIGRTREHRDVQDPSSSPWLHHEQYEQSRPTSPERSRPRSGVEWGEITRTPPVGQVHLTQHGNQTELGQRHRDCHALGQSGQRERQRCHSDHGRQARDGPALHDPFRLWRRLDGTDFCKSGCHGDDGRGENPGRGRVRLGAG